MTLEQIVEMYGSSRNKHLVSRRVKIKEEGPFKGIKTYRIELWEVETHQILCLAEKTCHMTMENEAYIIEDVELEIVKKMFELCL